MQDQGTAIMAAAGGGVWVLAAAVLRAGRAALGQSQARFATSAGVDVGVVAGVEDGTVPAWTLLGPVWERVVAAVRPELADVLYAALACDLLLTSVLAGEQFVTGDEFSEEYAGISRMLLRWAIAGELPVRGYARVPDSGPLLDAGTLARLHRAAGRLATSGSEDAWAGRDLLALFPSPWGAAA
ncbi:MAG TPA: hypothetical protein VGM53_14700 [Streptosporangiaceae bacterium]|jgi:hypothetical protein